jgi:hypothetical protein
MFKIVKGAVEGKKGKEALVEQLSKRLALTKPPDHVKKVPPSLNSQAFSRGISKIPSNGRNVLRDEHVAYIPRLDD